MLSKRILNLSTNLRSLIISPQFNIIHRFCRAESVTDQLKQILESISNRDDLFNEITIPRITSLLEKNEQTISGNQIVGAMNSLVKLCRQQYIDPKIVHNQELFRKLCMLIDSNMNKLKISEAIEILKYFKQLQVPGSMRVISQLLHHINNLLDTTSLRDFCIVQELLSTMEPTPSTRAMHKSLRKKFLKRISTEFDKDDLEFLANALRYTIHGFDNINQTKGILKTVISAIQDHTFQNESIHDIVTLMKSLTDLTYYPQGWETVLKRTQEHLATNIDQIHSDDISSMLRKISLKVKNDRNKSQYYDKNLVDSFIKRIIILDDVSFEKGILSLQSCNMLRHTNKELLNYLSAKFYEQKYLNKKIISYELNNLLILVRGLADLKHKPIFWDEILHSLKSKKLLENSNETLIVYALHLACFDCYDLAVLEKIFKKRHDFRINSYFQWTFLKLWQKLKVMPDYNGPMPQQEDIDSFDYLQKEKSLNLLTSLQQALGGSMYLKTNVHTKLYHHIDYLVAFQPGDNPIAINEGNEINDELGKESVEYLEDLNVPSNSQIVAVLSAPNLWYSRNTNQLLGQFSAYIETLETLSCRVVVINNELWAQLPKNSKSTFLMNEIQTKLDDSGANYQIER